MGRSAAEAIRSVFVAVRTNTWSPQTIGVELPSLGSDAFHLTFLLASQVTGGSPRGAVPLASGPRQWCQLSSRSGGMSPADAITVTPKRITANRACFIAPSPQSYVRRGHALPGEYIGTRGHFRRKHC